MQASLTAVVLVNPSPPDVALDNETWYRKHQAHRTIHDTAKMGKGRWSWNGEEQVEKGLDEQHSARHWSVAGVSRS